MLRMLWQAQRGGPKFEIAEEDALVIAEAMFPTVANSVSRFAAGNPKSRAELRRTVTITMADGEGEIPAEILVEYVGCDGTLLDPASTTKRYAYKPYHEFIRRGRTPLGLFTVLGEQRLLQREPDALYVLGEGFSDDMHLNSPAVVQRPALAGDAMECVPEIEAMLINTGAEALRGEILRKAVLA